MSKAKEDENRLFKGLPNEEYQRFATHLEQIFLDKGQVLYEWGEPIEAAYFPSGALVSLVSIVESGGTKEVGIIGSEGMVGLPIFLGGVSTTNRAIVQIAGNAIKLNAEILKAEFNRGGELQKRLLLYAQALFTQVAHIAICNSYHSVEARVARWLLLVQDCIQTNELLLTQEFIADMLGTQRPSVSEAINAFNRAEIIRSSRGMITILDRQALEARSCECYRFITEEYVRLLDQS